MNDMEDFIDPEIGGMLEELLESVPEGGFHDFLEDLSEQLGEKGWLSERQQEVIREAYERQGL